MASARGSRGQPQGARCRADRQRSVDNRRSRPVFEAASDVLGGLLNAYVRRNSVELKACRVEHSCAVGHVALIEAALRRSPLT